MLVLGIDVDGADDALFPQLAVVVELAVKLEEPHAGNAHGRVQVRPGGRGWGPVYSGPRLRPGWRILAA